MKISDYELCSVIISRDNCLDIIQDSSLSCKIYEVITGQYTELPKYMAKIYDTIPETAFKLDADNNVHIIKQCTTTAMNIFGEFNLCIPEKDYNKFIENSDNYINLEYVLNTNLAQVKQRGNELDYSVR